MSSSSYVALTEETGTLNPLYEINQQRWSRCSDFTAQVALAIITLLCASVVLAHLCGAIPYDYIAIAAGALFCVTLFLDVLLCMRNLPTIDPFPTLEEEEDGSAAKTWKVVKGKIETGESLVEPHIKHKRYQNHGADQSPWTSMRETLQDMRKGPTTQPPEFLPDEIYPDEPADDGAVDGESIFATCTWVGHATFLFQIQLEDQDEPHTILLDPNYSSKIDCAGMAWWRRMIPARPSLKETPTPDTILITHNHQDHMDEKVLSYFKDKEPQIFAPDGTGSRLKTGGFTNAHDFKWWETAEIKDEGDSLIARVTAVPAHHSSCSSATNV